MIAHPPTHNQPGQITQLAQARIQQLQAQREPTQPTQLQPQPTPTQELTPRQAVLAFADAGGNIELAVERLCRANINTTTAALVLAMSEPESIALLHRFINTHSLIALYRASQAAAATYISNIADLDPAQASRSYIQLQQLVAQQTAPPPPPLNQNNTINIYDKVLQMLPPEARDTFAKMIQNPEPPNTSTDTDPLS